MKGIAVLLSIVALALLGILGYALMNQEEIVAEDVARSGSSRGDTGTGDAKATVHHSLSPALKEAGERNGLVLIDFNATWCPPCKEFTSVTLKDKRVKEKMKEFVFAKIDVDAHGEDAARYQVRAIPTHMILSADGKVLQRKEGLLTPEQYIQFMDQAN